MNHKTAQPASATHSVGLRGAGHQEGVLLWCRDFVLRAMFRALHSSWVLLLCGCALALAEGQAAGRTVAVLEYRAGVSGAPEIASGMAEELAHLTAHQVITPAEGRLRSGASLDAQVAQCKGDPECISRLGSHLACDEVILVGVSQLGDLILAIQRIEVRSGRVLARLADSISTSRPIGQSELQSYLRRLLPSSDFKRYGKVVVRTEMAGDEVFLDEVTRGRTPLGALTVPAPGRYALRVARPGHEDFVARLDVLPEATVEVTPRLSRKSQPPRWYQQWWVWTIVGGVVAAGTAGAVVALTRGQDRVPAVIRLDQ